MMTLRERKTHYGIVVNLPADHTAQTVNAAAIKAFVVNRIGDFGFVLGWVEGEELGVVGEAGVVVVLDPVHGVGERHLAVAVVVAIALAVGGDVG